MRTRLERFVVESDPGRRDGLLVAIVESSDDSIFAQTLDGTILS